MNARYLIVVPVMGLSIAAAGLSQTVSAAPVTNSNICKIDVKGSQDTPNDSNSRFVVKDNMASTTFTISGKDCVSQEMSLASWTAPNGTDGKPFDTQKLFKSTTGTFKPGTYTMTTELPNCYYQLDLVTGKATADDGSALYGTVNGVRRVRAYLHGGTQSCTPVTPVSSVIPVETLPNTGIGSSVLWTLLGATVAGAVAFRLRLQRQTGR